MVEWIWLVSAASAVVLAALVPCRSTVALALTGLPPLGLFLTRYFC
jgi:hypothetical protein